ncbi:LANO_0E04478g1_1 [Lachancea nothofagi CBS 11611]|uniref:AP-3 complex subunit delta n=1 Tax=Lachancea nothofagi CBS 11611 TaxID=1266666 RepID=A0A1G4JS34_9SACH|nr:LANO_0E04478g1_1 [Lachancea nothofagi CBS 11611]
MASIHAPSAEDVMQRLRPFGLFFEKSLKDLIKGIRSAGENPEDLRQVMNKALSECREEVSSPDLNLKTNAVLKLTYLEMYGYDMSWANFHILEVMSSSKLQHKRVGYLAASQSFYKDPDILMLATNLLKKDLKYDGNNDVLKMAVTLSGLSTMVTTSLASDICDDLLTMLGSSKPYIRKKAVAALFKVFLQYPEALRDNFDKFVAKLEDEDLSVVSATVSVICEVSKKNPYPFIALSPLLYEMLFTIDNNWIIIRLLKLFTNLSQVEPKLRAKILPKVLELMKVTSATSVIYESINCIVKGKMLQEDDHDSAFICLQELNKFCSSPDPNLRYISVVLFYQIGKINTDFITEFNVLVIRLLKDVDISIRSRALELLEGATDDENITTVVHILIKQFIDKDVVSATNLFRQAGSDGVEIDIPLSYKVKMVSTILRICSINNYSNIPDFDWYIAVLSDLCVISQDLNNDTIGYQLGDELRNVMVKVPSMRKKLISNIVSLVLSQDVSQSMPMVLRECYWCIGEYSNLIDDGDDLIKKSIKLDRLPPDVLQIMAQALLKVFSSWCNMTNPAPVQEIKSVLQGLLRFYESLSSSQSFEVQERSVEFLEFCKLCDESLEQGDEELPLLITDILPSFFNSYSLNPILHGTQRKLQDSLMLDLDTPFLSEEDVEKLLQEESSKNDLDSLLASDLELDLESDNEPGPNDDRKGSSVGDVEEEITFEARKSLEEKRRKERSDNPFYLEADDSALQKKASQLIEFDGEEKPSDLRNVDTFELSTAVVKRGDLKKKKQSKKKKAQVLLEEGLPDLISSHALASNHPRTGSFSSSKDSSTINLKMQTKLESFDFHTPQISPDATKNIGIEEQQELENLRAKFAAKSSGNDQNADDEVVIVKKKKSKSKSKSKKKGSKKHASEPQLPLP